MAPIAGRTRPERHTPLALLVLIGSLARNARGKGTVPAYGVSLFLARPRLASEGSSEGPETGAVPYSVGGTVPAYGLNHFIFAPFFDPSEGRFQRSVAHA